MTPDYQLVERVATLEEYRELCTAVGWAKVMNFEAAETALPNSLYGVVVLCDNKVIGMGRIVGDGAIFYYVQDVAVHPDHQRKGVGKTIVGQLVNYVKQNAPEKAFLGVFAAEGTESFYRHYGFEHYPVLTGMFQVVQPQA